MKTSKAANLVLTTILLLIFINSTLGQKLEPKERITEPDHVISSELLGKDYQLYMSFPKNYLETADYENIELKWQIFDGETHLSVWPASTSKTITTLYGRK